MTDRPMPDFGLLTFQIIPASDRVPRYVVAPNMHDAVVWGEAHWGALVQVVLAGAFGGVAVFDDGEDEEGGSGPALDPTAAKKDTVLN